MARLDKFTEDEEREDVRHLVRHLVGQWPFSKDAFKLNTRDGHVTNSINWFLFGEIRI